MGHAHFSLHVLFALECQSIVLKAKSKMALFEAICHQETVKRMASLGFPCLQMWPMYSQSSQ